jgi:predicted transposase YdaD
MRARYEYKTLAITDYPDEVLEASINPFAVVLLVAKETLLQVGGTEAERDSVLLDKKLRIVRLLKERMEVFGERKTRAILTFLKNYVVFKKSETNLIFMEHTDQLLGKSKTMGIFEQLAEIKHQEGVQEGIQEGLEKAIRGLLVNNKLSMSEIAEAAGVPVDLVVKIKMEMSAT